MGMLSSYYWLKYYPKLPPYCINIVQLNPYRWSLMQFDKFFQNGAWHLNSCLIHMRCILSIINNRVKAFCFSNFKLSLSNLQNGIELDHFPLKSSMLLLIIHLKYIHSHILDSKVPIITPFWSFKLTIQIFLIAYNWFLNYKMLQTHFHYW